MERKIMEVVRMMQEAMIMTGHSKPETTMRYCSIAQEGVKYHHKNI